MPPAANREDRPTGDRRDCLSRFRSKSYGFRSLVHEIVQRRCSSTSKGRPASCDKYDHRGCTDAIQRRQFLRAAACPLALPASTCFSPAGARAADTQTRRRMIWHLHAARPAPAFFFPEKDGKDYALTPYLEVLQDFRSEFTGRSRPVARGDESGFRAPGLGRFLTGAQNAGAPDSRSISVRSNRGRAHRRSDAIPQAWPSPARVRPVLTRTGALVPAATSPSKVFARLFLDGRPDEVQAQVKPPCGRPGASSTTSATRPTRCVRRSAPTTATGSTSTSPACATWRSGLARDKVG